MEFLGKRIVISGGGSGIGHACASAFAKSGAKVALFDKNPNVAQALSGLDGSGHEAVNLDVTNYAEVLEATKSFAGIEGIYGVVASAGIVSQTPLAEITSESFEKILSVNVLGVQNLFAAVAKNMIENNIAGSMVAVGSVAAFNGGGMMGRGAYSTSKAALLGLVRSYARELASHKIRVNTVAPGATDTAMTQELDEQSKRRIAAQLLGGSFLKPQDIGNVVKFLISDDSIAINGQTIHANGGSYFG